MKTWFAAMVLVACATRAHAQALPIDRLTPPFPSAPARHVADVTSTGLVAAQIALATWNAWHDGNRGHAFNVETARIATTVGAVEVLKYLVGRDLPLHQDLQSWPSGHTALAFALTDTSHPRVTFSLAVGAGTGRVASGWHYLTDVLSGAALGYVVNRAIQ